MRRWHRWSHEVKTKRTRLDKMPLRWHLTKGNMDTQIQHKTEPSQGPSAILWHAKVFGTTHKVAAGAWETPPAVIRWLQMSSRMARCQSRIQTFPLSCVLQVSISGQCDTCIKSKHNNEKVEFMKNKGLCFGCLGKGHMSKYCKNRMTYQMSNLASKPP